MNRKLSYWVDCTVRANDGDVGTVEKFYFDDLTWTLRYMAVKTVGWLPGRTVLISLEAMGAPDWEQRVFPVNLTMAQVRSSPNIDVDQPVSRQHEVALHEHYAWPVYWNGGFFVPGELATVPASESETVEETPLSRARKLDPHLNSTGDVMACRVHATDGHIGHVEDFLIDVEARVIRYLVVNTRNWLPERRVLVSPEWISKVDWDRMEVLVDLTREAVKKSPKYNPAKPVTPAYEGKLFGHLKKEEATEWVIFKCHAPPGTEVHVAGTFNRWDPTAIRLGDRGKGLYATTVRLPVGRYEYKFIMNGSWRNGPDSVTQVPNPFGTTNSVLVVERTTVRDGHVHTFARAPGGTEDRLMWTTPMSR